MKFLNIIAKQITVTPHIILNIRVLAQFQSHPPTNKQNNNNYSKNQLLPNQTETLQLIHLFLMRTNSDSDVVHQIAVNFMGFFFPPVCDTNTLKK